MRKNFKVKIKVDGTIKADYPHLRCNKIYQGVVLKVNRRESMCNNTAYWVKLVGIQEPHVFFMDELEYL